jgi:hypothetical protein
VPVPPKPTDPRDTTFPSASDGYVGKLDPNYYCRAWNAKRQKYCKQRAGQKTDHVGAGRCNMHGGNNKVIHGQFRRYEVAPIRVRELMEEHADAANPLDLLPELALARALLQDFVERTAEDEHPGGVAEAIKLIARIAGIVDGIERAKAHSALSIKELDLLMLNMGRVVRQHVGDDAVCQRILDGWLGLRV